MSFVPDANSMLRTADNTVTSNEVHNAGNELVCQISATPITGLFWWIQNPAAITGTTPGLTVTLAYSNDKVTWVAGPSQTVLAKGVYLAQINTGYTYVSADLVRGNADNVIGTLSMGLTDAVTLIR